MARAARLVPATSSDASSIVRFGSWLITDITMLIMICRRRIFTASSWTSLPCAFSKGPSFRNRAGRASPAAIRLVRCAAFVLRCAHCERNCLGDAIHFSHYLETSYKLKDFTAEIAESSQSSQRKARLGVLCGNLCDLCG